MSDMHTQPYDDVKKPKDIGTEIKQELEAWNARKEKASASPPDARRSYQHNRSRNPTGGMISIMEIEYDAGTKMEEAIRLPLI